METLPIGQDGRIQWQTICRPDNAGKAFLCTRHQAINSYHQVSKYGYAVTSRTIGPDQVSITLKPSSKRDLTAISHTEYNAAKLRDGDTVRKLKEARENLVYWRGQKLLRTNPQAIADAGARVQAWQYQVNILSEKLTPALA